MEDKRFIKEKIVGRKEGWKKRLLHYLRVICSALLFGIVSAGVFVLSTPFFQSKRELETTERVELQTSYQEEPESTDESEIPETETTTVEETEPIEELVQSELKNYEFTLSDYVSMMQGVKKITSEAEKSLVEVTKSVNSTDFLGGEIASEDSFSGIILTITDNEVLICTPADAVQDLSKLEVSFLRGNRYEASLKAMDSLDNLAVISVPVKNIMEKDRNGIQSISFGNSKSLKRGDFVIAIGAPAGVLYSTSVGRISYLSYNQAAIDSKLEDIRADLHAAYSKGSFVINTSGDLLGWVSGRLGESEAGFVRIAGISDFLGRLEYLSNGKAVPYIGVRAQEVSAKMERQGIPTGIYVLESSADSPAYMAGIQAGDIIVQINDARVQSMDDFESELEKIERDDTINLTVRRARGQEYGELSFSFAVGGR